jgi:hypothetical protein
MDGRRIRINVHVGWLTDGVQRGGSNKIVPWWCFTAGFRR